MGCNGCSSRLGFVATRLLVVEQAKKSLTESAEVTEQVIERWRARLLMHGPTSDLGRMARHQLRLWEDRKAKTA